MKKIIFLLALAGMTAQMSAQDYEIPVKNSIVTNSFWSNWYVSGGVDFNAAYTSEENLGNRNPFSSDRGTFGFNVALGKWFTPAIGLRTKFQGAWSKQVMHADLHHAYNYWNLHEDVTFNLNNLLFGYRDNRIWSVEPYVGIGIARNMSYNQNDVSFNAGILNNFRIHPHWSVFLDVYYNSMDGSFDKAPMDNWGAHNKFAMRHCDKMVGLSLGVTYHIGKSKWEKAPDIEALLEMNREQMEAMNSSLEDQQNENARLRALLTKEKAPEPQVAEPVLVSTAHSVFFNIGSAKVANHRDLIDLKDLAVFAKQYNKQLVVTGYADSKTGSEERNLELSRQRAEVVADVLEKMGIAREHIVVEGKGGVDDIAPFSYNRRVIVKVR